MKKFFPIVLMVLAAIALLFGSCGGAEEAVTSQTTSTSAPPAAPTKLVMNNWFQPPEISHVSAVFEQWAKDFEAATGNRYTVEVVHGGALAALPDAYDALANGICDFGVFVPQDTNVPFPMQNLLTLPWGTASCTTATKALKAVYDKGYLDSDYDKVKLMYMFASTSQDDLLTAKPIGGIADMKGLKVAMGGGVRIDIYKDLNAAPVFCPAPDVYSMLQKGIVEGSFFSAYGVYMTHEDEFLFYVIDPMRFGRVSMMIGVNTDVYNKFPADVRKIIDDMDKDAKYSLMCADIMDIDYDQIMGQYLGPDGTGELINWSAADVAKLNDICAKYWQNKIAEADAAGLPATEMLTDYYNVIKAEGVANPAHGWAP